MKELIKSIIADFHKRGIPDFKKRDINLPLHSGKVITLIGPRRSGKTYTMFQVMSNIQNITDILYINFEDERLDLNIKNLNLIIEAYYELYPDKKKIYFFFDEVQEILGWEKFLRRIYDTISTDIFITGSSSRILSKEIATSLRGRTVTYTILPLSFQEYLFFKGIEKDMVSTRGKSKLTAAFSLYMERGGFPETIDKVEEFADRILQSYFEVMIYRDIVERYNLSNAPTLKLFIKRLIGESAKEFSINKIFNELKSQGIKISKDSLYSFLGYSEDAFIIFPVSQFSESLAKQNAKKAYAIDTGLSRTLSYSLSKDRGRVLENIVLLELKRREMEVHFFKGSHECDFIIKQKERITQAMQVCYELNKDNRDREIKGLTEAMKRFKLKKGVIITFNQSESIGNIEVIPAWRWILK